MRQLEIFLVNDGGPNHDQIDVEGTRPPPLAVTCPPERLLDPKRSLHQSPRLERGFSDHHDIEKLRTIGRSSDRRGLVYRRNIHNDDIRSIAYGVDRTLHVSEAIPEVGADGIDNLPQGLHAAQGVCV